MTARKVNDENSTIFERKRPQNGLKWPHFDRKWSLVFFWYGLFPTTVSLNNLTVVSLSHLEVISQMDHLPIRLFWYYSHRIWEKDSETSDTWWYNEFLLDSDFLMDGLDIIFWITEDSKNHKNVQNHQFYWKWYKRFISDINFRIQWSSKDSRFSKMHGLQF